MPFQIIRNSITKVRADAIVNTANPEPIYADGSDRAVYEAAGADALLEERRKIGRIEVGEAAATPAFALHAKYIIHTVGPVWEGGHAGEFEALASCYRRSLALARELGCGSIAFPLIATGVYGFPKDRALEIALAEIRAFLEAEDVPAEGAPEEDASSEMFITLVVFDRTAFDLSTELVGDVRAFIDDREAKWRREREFSGQPPRFGLQQAPFVENAPERPLAGSAPASAPSSSGSVPASAPPPAEDRPDYSYAARSAAPPPSAGRPKRSFLPSLPGRRRREERESPEPTREAGAEEIRTARSLDDLMSNIGETFQECLLRLIDEKGMTDPEVYKRANIDRKLFSKIRCRADYQPTKRTACAFAVALRLNMDEAVDLLAKAGLAFSPASRFDLILEYCIRHKIYDIFEVNALLFDYDQPLLG